MTWLDIALIVVWVIFLGIGARLGSLWTGACVVGGFMGAFVADYYYLPISEFLGGFAGAATLAWCILYLGTLGVVLIPGFLASRITSAIFLGVIDSAVGLVTGAVVGLLAIVLVLILIPPVIPKVERAKAWKNSALVRPLHNSVEDLFNKRNLRLKSYSKDLREKAMKALKPLTKEAQRKVVDFSEEMIEKITE